MKTLLILAFLVILGVVFAEEMQNGHQVMRMRHVRDVAAAPSGDGSQRRDGKFFGLFGGWGYPYYGGYGGYGYGGYYGGYGGYGGYGYPYGYWG